MIRPFTCVCMLLAGASGLYLYQAKHRAQLLDREIAATMHQAEQARERSGVLRAEWTLLNDPERLESLAARFLQLKTTQPPQFTNLAGLDSRLPAIRPLPSPPDTTDEPAPEPTIPLAAAEPVAPAKPPATAASPTPSAPAATSAAPPAIAAPAVPSRVAAAHMAARPPVHAAEPRAAERNPAEPRPAEARAERHPSHDIASALGYARSLAAGGAPLSAPVPMITPVSTPYLARPAPAYAPRAYAPPPYAAPTPAPVTGSALGMARLLPQPYSPQPNGN